MDFVRREVTDRFDTRQPVYDGKAARYSRPLFCAFVAQNSVDDYFREHEAIKVDASMPGLPVK
ncbi:hypothetical protein [Paraburkholderia sp. BR14320]|uniref:hypothetical protein n=1 Tax=unclassified Paraburkholderia TaxID=2615204 RepID=UPI0034CE21C7